MARPMGSLFLPVGDSEEVQSLSVGFVGAVMTVVEKVVGFVDLHAHAVVFVLVLVLATEVGENKGWFLDADAW